MLSMTDLIDFHDSCAALQMCLADQAICPSVYQSHVHAAVDHLLAKESLRRDVEHLNLCFNIA